VTPDPATLLPPVEVVDALPPDALPGILAHLLALQARVVARIAMTATSNGHDPQREPPYDLAEAARLLLKSAAWVRRHAKAGRIPCAKKHGRSWVFPRAEFDHFRTRRTIG